MPTATGGILSHPFFKIYQVAAIDVSGALDSEHRDSYSDRNFTNEIIAVLDNAGFE